jgi:hypothetical protein
MKQLMLLITMFVTLASCNFTTGSGNIISEDRSVNNFTELSVGGDFDVEISIGAVTQVKVEADDNIMKYIETNVSGNTLKIRKESNHNFSDAHMKVYITVPVLAAIRASASADVVVQDVLVSKEKLTFRASSGAEIKVDVDAPEIDVDASSSATVTISGKTRVYKAEASSSADIKSWDLLSENATVNVSSSASARVHASVSLKAKASSSADVIYHGSASVDKSVSSSGSVRKED